MENGHVSLALHDLQIVVVARGKHGHRIIAQMMQRALSGRFSGPSNSWPRFLAAMSAALFRASGSSGGIVPVGPTISEVRLSHTMLDWALSKPNWAKS